MITKVQEQKMPGTDKICAYGMTRDGILYSVPLYEDNSDYQKILKWVEEGNTIEPADD